MAENLRYNGNGCKENNWDSGYRGADAGKKLKSSTIWNGDNYSDFNLLAVGYRTASGALRSVGAGTHLWSSTLHDLDIWVRDIYSGGTSNKVGRYTQSKLAAFSVRCILGQ